jgi:sigma-E factor negative regulatory protein RseA
MTQEISSLMDGELDHNEAERAIRSCCTGREAADTWRTYHLIGDAMRGGRPHPTNTAERVWKALANEPAIIARPKRVYETTIGRVAIAAAASVATIGVVGWIGTQGGQVPGASPIIAGKAVPAPSVQPVANTQMVPPATLDVQDYLTAHRQVPSPESYRTVNSRAPAAAAGR